MSGGSLARWRGCPAGGERLSPLASPLAWPWSRMLSLCRNHAGVQAEASEGSQPAAATAEPGAPREGGSGTEPQAAADAEGGRNAPQAVAAANKEVRGTEPQAAVNDKESSVAEPQAAAGADPPQAAAGGGPKALFRTFPPSFWMYAPDVCALVHPEHLPVMDTCDWNGQ